jgi:hypothetical protein
MEDRMTLSLPTRRAGRRTALAATLALAVSGFAFAATEAAEAKPCPPDICDTQLPKKPKFPWPDPPCYSCPDPYLVFERYQEIVLPELEVDLLPEILDPHGPEAGGLERLAGGGGPGGR